ncbi:syntaxin-11-like isoform X3 [Sardina pilchardus]|uniref:syntaxin-11-like isoform X3 n=1 Tax=Sardina pilchardus TaxID=27697 RepID=UPI002E1026CE
MRDRLEDLGVIQEEGSEGSEGSKGEWAAADDSDDEVDDEGELKPQAVVFEEDAEMEEVLQEAQAMRREIGELGLDVERLRKQTSNATQTVRRLSTIYRSSNAIGGDVKTRAEALVRRLAAYDQRRQELEQRQGPTAAVVRIARAQYTSISHALRQAMAQYNAAEQEQRECCRNRFQRQAEILGRAVTSEEGPMMNHIEHHVVSTHEHLLRVNESFKMAIKYRKRNPCIRICCGCFPCYKNATG